VGHGAHRALQSKIDRTEHVSPDRRRAQRVTGIVQACAVAFLWDRENADAIRDGALQVAGREILHPDLRLVRTTRHES